MLLCIYMSGTFHVSAYEVVHFCMHLGDIVELEFTPHSHHGDQTMSSTQHSHGAVLDQLDINQSNDDESEHLVSSDDNQTHEIAQGISVILIESYNREDFHYSYHKPLLYLKAQLPPPKSIFTK